MDLVVDRSEGAVRLAVSGELDLAHAHDLKAAGLQALDDPDCKALVLDLSGVAFIDSTGIGVLVDLKNAAEPRRTPLSLREPSRRVREVLELTAMDTVFPIDPS